MCKAKLFVLFFMGVFGFNGGLAMQKMIVAAPVASLWTMPNPPELGSFQAEPANVLYPLPLNGFYRNPAFKEDRTIPHHDTQLLYGERVALLDEPVVDGWVKIQALEQHGFDAVQKSWRPMEGWVRSEHLMSVKAFVRPNVIVAIQWAKIYARQDETSDVIVHVPFGALLYGEWCASEWYKIVLSDGREGFVLADALEPLCDEVIDGDVAGIRDRVVTFAKEFAALKSPYLWGGRSPLNPDKLQSVIAAVGPAASVDCSGLVNIVYRACGINVPRDAHPQFLKATPVAPADLEKGDLLFIENTNAKGVTRVRHLMIYAGLDSHENAWMIEAASADEVKEKRTRMQTTEALFGLKNLKNIHNGESAQLFEDGNVLKNIKIYGGTFLDRDHVQALRTDLLNCPQVQ